MDDKLESFVTLLNKQRQLRPPAPEPVRAPSWAQRMFSKRPDAPAAPVVQQAAPESKPETASESAPVASPIVPPAEIVTAAAAEPVAEPIAEVPAVAAAETPQPQFVADAPAEEPVAEEIVEAPAAAAEPSVAAEAAAAVPEEVSAAEPMAAPLAESAALASEESAVGPALTEDIIPTAIAADAIATPDAAPEIATVAAAELVAEPVAEETVAPVEAAALAPIPPDDIVSAVSAEAAVAAPEATPDIPVVAAAEPVAEPVVETPVVSEAAAVPPVAAEEAAPIAAAPPEAPEPAAIPDAASPRIAAIFTDMATPDTVSAAIAESAAAVVAPPEAPAVAETDALAVDAAPAEPAAAEPAADALRDPHDLLARFLAETDIAVTPAPEQVLAEAAAKLDEVLQAVATETPSTRADDDAVDADDEPAVPLPVMAEQVAAARASRGYLRYGLTAIAVVAGVVVVGGAYWSTQAPSITLAGGGAPAPTAAMTAMNVNPAKPAITPADPSAAARPPAPKLAVTAKAGGAPSGSPNSAAAATILATLPPAKAARGLAIVEAKPASARQGSATALAQAPRQLAMLTPPPLEPPPTPVTSSMAPPPPAPAAAAGQGPAPTWERNAVPAPPYSGKPQIAIVIDDLGIDRDRTERSVGLNGAVTLSFLAYASDLPTQTEAARRAGHELIVHVPMEPAIRPKYISQTSGDEAQAELLRRLRWDLSRFTGYVGVNDHMGSRLSADPHAMHTVIGELKARGLLFLDSRLDGDTIDVAQHEGVAAVGRDVLLDDDITAGSVADRLAQVEKVARQRGTAIALGHPHDQTINALKLWIASLSAKGLQLVPLSAIVKDREAHVAGAGGGAG